MWNESNMVAISRETPEKTRNSQAKNIFDPGKAQEHISQVSEENERRVFKRFSKEISREESRILCALPKLDDCLLNPQIRTCSIAVPGTSGNNCSLNQEPTGYRFLGEYCPRAVFSTYHSGNLNYSEQEETHHINPVFPNVMKLEFV